MSKPTFNKHLFKQNDFLSMAIALTILSLVVSCGIELLAMELFRLG